MSTPERSPLGPKSLRAWNNVLEGLAKVKKIDWELEGEKLQPSGFVDVDPRWNDITDTGLDFLRPPKKATSGE